jgi:UvrD-like helicase C-terminal domain
VLEILYWNSRPAAAETREPVQAVFEQADGLQAEIKRLSDRITADVGSIFNLLMNTNKTLLDEVAAALPAIRGEEEEEPEEDADEAVETVVASGNVRLEAANILLGALRNWARAIAEGRHGLSGQSGRAIDFIKAKLPPDSRFAGIGADIATRAYLRTLVSAPRTLVLGVPGMYARFRRQALRDGRHFQSNDAATQFLNRSLISSEEVDVLLLVMLRNARRIIQYSEGRRLQFTGQYDWLENIRGRHLTQVFVDEATDFSAVQLACTIELSDPRLRSWFACGDLRQRITAGGIQDDGEIEWLNRTAGVEIDVRRVDIGYRQSRRLRELSDALAGLLDAAAGPTSAPRGDEEADVWPLLGESLSGAGLAQWLADRIHEVERGIGRPPSIAVFVDGDHLIDPLVDATKPLLDVRNIPIVGCKEGRIAGDEQEVRVFDVQHIKGLEFEAVFFIGIDRLAERIPDLFERFLYVGVTRAATYLGLTCERGLPKQLEPLRRNFGADDWSGG